MGGLTVLGYTNIYYMAGSVQGQDPVSWLATRTVKMEVSCPRIARYPRVIIFTVNPLAKKMVRSRLQMTAPSGFSVCLWPSPSA